MEYIGSFECDKKLINNEAGIVIFGAGKGLSGLLDKMEKSGIKGRVLCICDNNSEQQGNFIQGIQVISPEEAICRYSNAMFIVYNRFCEEISKQLIDEGIERIHLIRCWNVESNKREASSQIKNNRENGLLEIPLKPVSSVFGLDRGLPIDRYYIEKFLAENASFIKGTTLEVADREYTMKYGRGVEESIVTHVDSASGSGSRLVNLETGEGVTDDFADCFILTQTLPFIYDIRAAAQNIVRSLKRGGVALVTVPGITQISRYDMDRWGHYWSFTTASLKRLFEECDHVEDVEIRAYGNVKAAACGLYGLAVEDMRQEDLEYRDDDYQQIITAVVRKSRGDLSR